MEWKVKTEIYTKENIDKLRWPGNKLSKETKGYFLPLIKNGTKKYIKNVETEIGIIKYGNLVLPFTLNNSEYDNSYVCSPYGQYIKYSKEELYLIDNKLLRGFLKFFLSVLSVIFKLGKINKVIIINNWLLSTNLYPKELDNKIVKAIHKEVLIAYPNHAIMFKSLNKYFYKNLYSILRKVGFNFIGSRQIYIYDYNKKLNNKIQKKLRKEFRLLDEKDYFYQDMTDNEESFSRASDLYTDLYVNNYSKLNPQITKKFIRNSFSANALKYKMLIASRTNKYCGVLGYFLRDNIMTTSILGYDLSYGNKSKLYRRLSVKLTDIVTKNKYLLNRSSGVSKFKMSRGAFSEIEYNAVYYKHLSFCRRFSWIILEKIINSIGVKLLEENEL